MSKFHQSFFYLFFFYLSCLFLLGTQGKHWLSNSFNELQDAAADKDSYALGYLALVHLYGDKGRDISMQDALAFAEASAEKNHWLGHFVMGYLARFVPYGPNPAMVKMHYLKG